MTTTTALVSGNCRSCGCIHKERITSPSHRRAMVSGTITHGMSKTPTYRSWACMLTRCTNPNVYHYSRYGGRGIRVCERWQSFDHFFADMGERPKGATLDRFPGRDGNYEPSNCRWATLLEQSHNRDSTVLNEDLVREIRGRADHGEGQKSIAARMGVTSGHVGNIIARRAWGHVP